MLASGASALICEAEIPAQRPDGSANPQAQDWHEVNEATHDLGIDRSVATSWAPFQKWVMGDNGWQLLPAPELAAELIRDDWYVMPYVYTAENPGDTVAGKLFYATHYTHEKAPEVLGQGEGWYHPEPVLGTYGGLDLDDPPFTGWRDCSSVSVWDAGEQF